MSRARITGAIFWCLFAFAPISCWSDNLNVLVVLSESSSPYKSFAETLRKNLPASIQLSVLDQSEVSSSLKNIDLVVSVGLKASLSAITQTGISVLAVMIPKAGYEEMLAQLSPQKRIQAISVIYLEQPWTRQLDFIRAALPKKRRIGLLYSPNAQINLAYLRQQFSEHGATLIAKPVLSAEKLFPTLDDLLQNSDVLLALPDNAIYNSINIRNILLNSYRDDIPFIGLSQAYVTAGALGAIFSSPEQVSGQVVSMALAFSKTGKLPGPQYPREFSISLNLEVGRSLGIELPSIDVIRGKMNSEERRAP